MSNENNVAQVMTVDSQEFRHLLWNVKSFTGDLLRDSEAALIANINAHTAAVTARAVEQLQHQNAAAQYF
jgi:hypothetical protein